MTTQQDPISAIRKEQEFHGRQMAQREQSQHQRGGSFDSNKKFNYKKVDRPNGKSQQPKGGRKYEGHEAELHEAIKAGAVITLHKTSQSEECSRVKGVILDMDKFAIKLRDAAGEEHWFYKHAFEAITIEKV